MYCSLTAEFGVAERTDEIMSPSTASVERQGWISWRVGLHTVLGTLLALNFLILWAGPMVIQGLLYRLGLHRVLRPIHRLLHRSQTLRRFAAKYIYRQQLHVDYFATAILFAFWFLLPLSAVIALQVTSKSLSWYVVLIYYFIWVGPGARCMAAAYTFAHREGHLPGGRMYRPWIRKLTGNVFENWIGIWFGIIPHSFSTTHLLLHHRLDAGKGDPIYLWDIDRTSFWDVMRYQWRFFRYMTGLSSVIELRREQGVLRAIDRGRRQLVRGAITYWFCVPAVILTLLMTTGSSLLSALLFLFFIYFQPLCGISCFLSLINIGQHGFLEFDHTGRHVKHVTSVTIIDGFDDSFGEDFHLAHHYSPSIGHDRMTEHVATESVHWGSTHGSVFEKTTIFELAVLMLLGRFDVLVRNHYVDYSQGELSEEELAELFKRRAQCKEMSYEEYEFRYLPRLKETVEELVESGVCTSKNGAYVYQAHRNLTRTGNEKLDRSGSAMTS